MLKWKVCHFEGAPIPSLSLVLPPDWRPRLHSGAPCSILVPPGSILVSPGSILKVFLYFFFEFWYICWIFCLEMFTGILHPMRVQKRLCVSVLGGKQSIYFSRFRKYFGIFWCFCTINCYFEYRIRSLCILGDMGTWFKDVFEQFSTTKSKTKKQKCEQFWYKHSFVIFGEFWSYMVPLRR